MDPETCFVAAAVFVHVESRRLVLARVDEELNCRGQKTDSLVAMVGQLTTENAFLGYLLVTLEEGH